MKKLIIACGLSVALSSAASAEDCGASFPSGSDVVSALSNANADKAITGLLASKLSSSDPYAYVSSSLVLTPTLATNGNCHYMAGTELVLAISATNPNPPKTVNKK